MRAVLWRIYYECKVTAFLLFLIKSVWIMQLKYPSWRKYLPLNVPTDRQKQTFR